MKRKLLIAGIIVILYGIFVLNMTGYFYWFNYMMLFCGIVLSGIALYYNRIKTSRKKVVIYFRKAVFAAAVIFSVTEALIIGYGFSKPDDNADYLIIFGSQVKNNGPSMDYRARIEKAYDYLIRNENTIVIVSGGQGSNERISEALCGKETLVKMGIDPERIIMEDESTSTYQNLYNSRKIIGENSSASVVFVSANYHLLRINFLAEQLGYHNFSSSGSNGLFFLVPYYYFREFFALLKEIFVLAF